MSNAMTPMFEMQRTMIEQNRKAFLDGVEAQKTVFETLTDGVDSSRGVAEQNAELSRSAMMAYVDTLESVTPEDAADFEEIRASIDEGFEAFEDSQAGAWDAFVEAVEESGVAFEEFADSYAETVDSSFDAVLQTHEEVEAGVDDAAESIPVESE